MLTYVQWKKIYDVGLKFIDNVETTSDVITGFLAGIGVVEAVAVDVLVKIFGWIGKWGFKFIMWLIPHESEDSIGKHPGDMKKLDDVARKSGDKPVSMSELKQTANAIPLVALKPALKDRGNGGTPDMKPLDPVDIEPSTSTPTISAMPVPPFGTGFKPNLSAKHAHYEDILKADLRSYHMDRLKKTAPYLWNGSPVAGAPAIGFIDAQKIYKRTEPVSEIYPNYEFAGSTRYGLRYK